MGSEVVIVPIIFGTIAFIVWTVVNGWLRRQHVKSIIEFNTRLVERIGSVKDFSDFLQTDGGAKFFESLTVERGSIGAHERILRGAAIGTVFIVLGLGFVFLGWLFRAEWNHESFMVVGVIALSLGIGGVLSSGLSYRLARVLGLLGAQDHGDRVHPASR